MQVSLAFVLAAGVEIIAAVVTYIVIRYSLLLNYGRLPDTDRRDAYGLFAFGTVIAGLLAASHFVPWPAW